MPDVLMYIIFVIVLIYSPVALVMFVFSVIYLVTEDDPDTVVDKIIKYVWIKKHRSEFPQMIENSFVVKYAVFRHCVLRRGILRRVCIHFDYYSDDGRRLSHTEYFKWYKRKHL